MVIEQFVPFVNGYDFFEKMGVKVYDNGHSYTGVNFSIHSKYSRVGEYERRMVEAYGEERAHAILGEARHNTVYYPEPHHQGRHPGDPCRAAARRRQNADRELDVQARGRA